ncbi:MAG: YchJ family metal-binding protein [Pseudomonadota bacterium]
MPPTKVVNPQLECPCGSEITLANCCLPYINRQTLAPTAEILMRSRYTAHVLLAIDYLWDTWSPEQRLRSSQQEILAWASSCEWLNLHIISTSAGTEKDEQGIVIFTVNYRQSGKLQQHHEISLFKKIANNWLYVNHQGHE